MQSQWPFFLGTDLKKKTRVAVLTFLGFVTKIAVSFVDKLHGAV